MSTSSSGSVDLSVPYLGMTLRNPLVVAACPVTAQLDKLLLMEQAGAAAFVFPSLFEEQIQQEERFNKAHRSPTDGAEPPSISYFPGFEDFATTPNAYLRLLEQAKKSVSVPVIGSLNGTTSGGWTKFANLIESAGADALELNMYYLETDPAISAMELEERYLELVRSIRDAIKIPLAIKLGPYFTALANFAGRLATAGANGLVLFNRFFQPEIDPERFEVAPSLKLSDPSEIRLPLRWIALLHGQTPMDLAATTGVHSAAEVIKYLLAGANVTMLASAVILHGPPVIAQILADLEAWLASHGRSSVAEIQGLLSSENSHDRAAFERANYMKTLLQYIHCPERVLGSERRAN